MGFYLLRRLLTLIPTLAGVLVITFMFSRSVPGSPCEGMLGPKATPEMCERFIAAKGLDKPLPVQLSIYMRDVVRGDFGNSLRFNRPVMQILVERLPATIELSLTAFAIVAVIGIPIGILSATYRNSPFDVMTFIGTNIGVSMPVFLLGLLLMYLFALLLRDTPFWLPPSGRLSSGVRSVPFYELYGLTVATDSARFYLFDFLSNLYIFNSLLTRDFKVLDDTIRHLILPAVTISIIPLALIARMTHSSLTEELGLNYVQTAQAKGLPTRIVIMKHAFRNALLPIVTIMGLQLGALLSGAILAEIIFSFPGLGRMLYESIIVHDYQVVQAIVVVVAFVYVLVNLTVELTYAVLDPRLRLK